MRRKMSRRDVGPARRKSSKIQKIHATVITTILLLDILYSFGVLGLVGDIFKLTFGRWTISVGSQHRQISSMLSLLESAKPFTEDRGGGVRGPRGKAVRGPRGKAYSG